METAKLENAVCILCVCGDNFPSEAAYQDHQRMEHDEKDDSPEDIKQVFIPKYEDDMTSIQYFQEDCDIKEEIIYELTEEEEISDAMAENNETMMSYETIMTCRDRLKREHNYNKREKEFFCETCGQSFASQSAVDTHAALRHTAHGAWLACEQCGQTFQTARAVRTHCSLVHRARKPGEAPPARVKDTSGKTDCEYCGRMFPSTRSVHMHASRAHAAEWRSSGRGGRARPAARHACDLCGRTYGSRTVLRYHQYTHTGERPFACSMCPKRFTAPMYLEIHLRRHNGEKPHACLQCPKAFPCRTALLRHERTHTGDRPYPCEVCGKMFAQSGGVKLHIHTVHLKLPAPPVRRAPRGHGVPRGESRLQAETLARMRNNSTSSDSAVQNLLWAET